MGDESANNERRRWMLLCLECQGMDIEEGGNCAVCHTPMTYLSLLTPPEVTGPPLLLDRPWVA